MARITSVALATRLATVAGAAIGLASPSLAQTWTGLSATTSNWTDAANWTTLPANTGAANLTFSNATRLNMNLNANWDVNTITFSNTAGSFTVNGAANTLTVRAGGISSATANTTSVTNNSLIAAANQTWSSSTGTLLIAPTQLTLNFPVSLNVTGTGTIAINSTIAGTGLMNKLGSGTLLMGQGTLLSTNSGLISVIQGTLRTSTSNAISDVAMVSVSTGASLILGGTNETLFGLGGGAASSVDLQVSTLTLGHNGADTLTYSGVISGAGSLTKSGTFTQALAGANTYTGPTTVSAGTLDIVASERLSDASDLAVSGGTFNLQTFTETLDQVTITGGTIQGGGQFGSGTIVANAFDFQGGFVAARINGPTSLVKSNTALNAIFTGTGSTYSGPTTITGGTLLTNAPNVLPDSTVVTVTAPGVLQVTNFPDTVAGIAGNGTIAIGDTTFTVGAGNTSSTFPGVISDLGTAGHLTKIGTGSLTLSGSNTYRGTTTLVQGSLRLNDVERLADTSRVVINAGQFITQSETVDIVTLNGGELRGHIVGVGSIGANTYNFNAGFCDALLSGPGALIKATPGAVSLRGPNSHAFTRIDEGTLIISADSDLGAPNGSLLLNGGTLSVAATCTINRPFGSLAASTIDCAADVLCTNFAPFNSGTLTKTGPGRLTLAGAPTSSGAIVVAAGELRLAPSMSLPLFGGSVGSAGLLTVDGGILNLFGPFSNFGRTQLSPGTRIVGSTFTNLGILSGGGTIASNFVNNAAGSVRIAENQPILFSNTNSLANLGLIEVLGGTAEFSGVVNNSSSTGLIFARDASLRFNAGLTNFGAVALSFGVSDIFGDIDNRATGVITISGASDATFIDDVINNGTLRTSTGSASVFLGALSGSGTFPGTGVVFMEGDLRPGNSPGRMTFGGDLIIGTFAGTQAEIAGVTAGAFDTIDVAGTVVLDGTLDVAFVRDFRPSGCDSLTIIHANAVVGSFHTVHLPNNAALVYHPDRVELLLSGCPADLDDGSSTGTPDCGVTVDDLLYFIDGYTLGLLRADLDDGSSTGTPDGGVTIDDLLYYLDRYTGGC